MYDQTMRAGAGRGRRNTVRHRVGKRQSGRGREGTLLLQFMICLTLFLTVFIGKGIFPGHLVRLREDVRSLISTDFDFRGAFAELGESLAGSGTMLEDLGDFCVQVFGAAPQDEPAQLVDFQPPQPAAILTSELLFFGQEPDLLARTEHYADISQLGLALTPAVQEEGTAVAEEPEKEEPVVLPAGTVVQVSDYDGQELPSRYTMDQLSLGDLETMTPVMGHLNSEYGYRDHPINGKADFHGGVDIGGQMGDPIAAFADGVVEYIGEDDSYGLYLQIDHGNGVKSFYAHCSKINVSKGQPVSMGDTVALIGSTGTATGPHLHLELKYGQMHLNPAYYVEFAGAE